MKRGIMKFASAALLSAMLSNGWLVPSPEETMEMAMASMPTATTETAAEQAKTEESPLPASKKEKPTKSNVTAVSEPAAATSVSWKKEPPAQEATIEVGFVIQPPEPPKEPAPTEENSTSWQPEPSPEAKISLDFVIQAPEPPKETPEPTPPTEQPLLPEPQPTEPPIEPTPEPEQSEPSQEPTSQQPSDQCFAHCSCGATLSPEELFPHMKGHAMKGESHSYSAH